MEPRRERLGARTLPCDYGEKRTIKDVWMCLGEKLERRERICLEKFPKSIFSCKMRGLEAFIAEN